jgi:hypothetical protein
MAFLLKLLANLYDPKDGDTSDRIITAMTRLTPTLKSLALSLASLRQRSE